MGGDSNEAKINYFHHWIDTAGEAQVESLINNDSYFTLFELLLAPKYNPLLTVVELYVLKQGSMTCGEFHAQITETAKRCDFPKKEAEERAIRDVLYRGMNSTWVMDKAINLMNDDKQELKIEFLMQHLEIADSNSHHKSLIQLDSTTSVNFAVYDHKQNKD